MGTPDRDAATAIPAHINAVVPTTFARKTVKPTATPFPTFALVWIHDTMLSNCVEIATDTANRTGRTILLKTQKPLYTAKNFGHCPAARGLSRVRWQNMYHAAETLTQ